MITLLYVIALAVAAFVATSLDNFLILLGFFGDDEYPRRQVFVGYGSAITVVILGAYVAAQAVEMAPIRYLGILGLIPLSLGLLGVVRLLGVPGPDARAARPARAKGAVPVLLVMLANSGDSFAVYISVFSDTRDAIELPIFATVAVLTLANAALARWLVTRSAWAGILQRLGRVVLPFLLMAIGAYILLDTGTDPMP